MRRSRPEKGTLAPASRGERKAEAPASVAGSAGSGGLRSLLPWLDAVPILWLALVISAYALLALQPMESTRREIPGIEAAERSYWPLLLSLCAAAIMRYLDGRSPGAASGGFSSERAANNDQRV